MEIDTELYQRVLAYCRKIDPNPVVAEDLVQEAWKRLFDYQQRTGDTIHPDAYYNWLCFTARNYWIDFQRYDGRLERFFAVTSASDHL